MNGYVNREHFKTRKYCIKGKLLAQYTHELPELFLFAKPGNITRVYWKNEGWEELEQPQCRNEKMDWECLEM